MRSKMPVRPERLKEVSFWPKRHAANHIAQRRSEKDREQNASQRKDGVKEILPDTAWNQSAELDSNTPQHEQPEHHHQRQIESAKTGRVELRKCKVEGSTGSE